MANLKKLIKSRKIKNPKIGDYVLLTRWGDADSNDPFYVGFLDGMLITKGSIRFRCEGSLRLFNHCWRITKEEGDLILEQYGEKRYD